MTKPRKGTTCPTGKRRYRDKTEAQNALVSIRRNTERIKVPSRIYPCALCRGYHLTSQEPRPR